MKLVIASRNRHKIKEIKQILKDFNWEIISLPEMDCNFSIIEDGITLQENATKKAENAMKKFGYITLGEDTGLEVNILDGRPGVFSARYAGEKASYQQNVIKLLAELKDIPTEQRTARFRCVCVLEFPKSLNRKPKIFNGICEGYIIKEPKGGMGFGYDPIFIPNGYTKTFAELSQEVKNKISHRAKALNNVKLFLAKFIKNNAEGGS